MRASRAKIETDIVCEVDKIQFWCRGDGSKQIPHLLSVVLLHKERCLSDKNVHGYTLAYALTCDRRRSPTVVA